MRARLLLRVSYDAPALDCRRVLHILPLPHLPIEKQSLSISPTPTWQEERSDRFGNRVLHLLHARIERELILSLDIQVSPSFIALPVERTSIAQWKLPSRAVDFSPPLLDLAREFRTLAPAERAEKLNHFVFNSLIYTSATTPHPSKASIIWTYKQGTCADFAHLLLSLGRACGLPARYIAGFGPAAGALHAWVEFGVQGHWQAFDPTHGGRAEGFYIPVAIGRDFYDCSPHQGSFRGVGARLEMHCELNGGSPPGTE